MKLYSYWRSGTSYRVRLALAIKGVEVDFVPVNLLEREHKSDWFRAINPQGLVPSLALDDGTILSQSPAIIEYIDEVCSGPKLLPDDPLQRARGRQLCALIGCDIHPVQNLRVLKRLQDEHGQTREVAFSWAAHFIDVGFEALEAELQRIGHVAPFLGGDQPGAPDCYLLPQLYAGRRFGARVDRFERLLEIENRLAERTDLRSAHPDAQPDAPKE